MEEISHIGAIDTVRVLANEERLRLLRLLMRGPATLTQLGAVVGHHPAWVRHHILSLEQAGLVELVETRPTKGYVEKFYCATARAYGSTSWCCRTRGSAACWSSSAATTWRSICWPAACARTRRAPTSSPWRWGASRASSRCGHGVGHVAGCHLFDAETGDFNRSYARALFPGRALVLVTLAHRQQGLIVPAGNPGGLEDLAAAVTAGARLVNRNRGSGTRVWLDRLLAGGGVDPLRVAGYGDEVMTHDAAARAVAEGAADVALGILRRPPRTASTSSPWSRSATTWSLHASTTRASSSHPCSTC